MHVHVRVCVCVVVKKSEYQIPLYIIQLVGDKMKLWGKHFWETFREPKLTWSNWKSGPVREN